MEKISIRNFEDSCLTSAEETHKNEIVSVIQDWGNGTSKIKISSTRKGMEAAIRYATHWSKKGDLIARFNSLGTKERDQYIQRMSIYFNSLKSESVDNIVEYI